jgi:hypothetical protein
VEAYRAGGKNQQRVICNLGRTELLAPQPDSLIRILSGAPGTSSRSPQPEAVPAWDWGPILVAQPRWRELGLATILERVSTDRRLRGAALADRALVLVANRLWAAAREHGRARWLDNDCVCDRHRRPAGWLSGATHRSARVQPPPTRTGGLRPTATVVSHTG